MSLDGRVPGFLPSSGALHFPNTISHGPVMRLGHGALSLPIGDAAKGLCGGMVFAARDLFELHVAPPVDRMAPSHPSPLFRYLVRRLFASWNVPGGPFRYMLWMLMADGTVRRRTAGEWPKVKAEIDAGKPSPIGLVRARSINPMALARNHQMLAYAYSLDEATGRVRLSVYDPNRPDDDDAWLELGLGPSPAALVDASGPTRGLFRTAYKHPGRAPWALQDSNL